jgi:2-polyprenyl-3-methyl-5-hydroxy-6-metoxy-1,4-benzoquinol methylase
VVTEPPALDPDRPNASAFNYDSIPKGYYDTVARSGNPVRRLWHVQKFERVLDYLPVAEGQSILDVGCFAGTFLSLVPERRMARQVGVDILPEQIAYAQAHYGSAFRRFQHIRSIDDLHTVEGAFDAVTLVEVVEHLAPAEIISLFRQIADKLKPGGRLVVTTPNYTSAWPLLEVVLNRVSDVAYEEQHVTKFNYFNFEWKLATIYRDLFQQFTVELKTTTHFVTPFLAALSYDLARDLSRVVPHQKWRHPFGNLVLMVLARRP